MARRLHRCCPAFREAFDRCAALLSPHLSRPLHDVVFGDGDGRADLDNTAYTQPALFAVEYALTETWRSFGVTPNILAGHSIGEIVAATVAGVFSLEDGIRLIARRGALMAALPPGGAMAAIAASEQDVAATISPHAEPRRHSRLERADADSHLRRGRRGGSSVRLLHQQGRPLPEARRFARVPFPAHGSRSRAV